MAFEILRRVEDGAFASILLASKQDELKPADRTLTHELVLGVLRRQLFLDSLITHFSNRQLSDLDLPVRIVLRLGIYQLRFLTRVPASAAVNESVKLVRYGRIRSAEGFVNAVLRRATREPEFDPTAMIEDEITRLAIATSHPEWLLKKWINSFGIELTTEFAQANNIAPPVAFRVVQRRANESQVIQELRDAGAKPTKSRIAENGWRFEGAATPLLKLAREGVIYIQDEASQLVAELATSYSSESILDLCAAPGSKTTLMADRASKGSIIACDVNEPRLLTVVQTAQLHGLTNIQYVVADGTKLLPFSTEQFETVLVDAPCSGTGTLRRNPEIRWRITAPDFEKLSTRQTQLLENAATVLKLSGTIVYSTCSVEPEENESVVNSFLSKHPEFVPEKINSHGPLKTDSDSLRSWPQRDGCDGFFLTVLRRKPIEN